MSHKVEEIVHFSLCNSPPPLLSVVCINSVSEIQLVKFQLNCDSKMASTSVDPLQAVAGQMFRLRSNATFGSMSTNSLQICQNRFNKTEVFKSKPNLEG